MSTKEKDQVCLRITFQSTSILMQNSSNAVSTISKWNKLDDISLRLNDASLVQINDDEFLVTTEKYKHNFGQGSGIYIYNVKERKWRLFMKYPSDMFVSPPLACFDKARNLLFIYHNDRDDWIQKNYRFTVINMESKQHSLTEKLPDSAESAYIVGTKDEIHIIGGFQKNVHHIFNKQSTKTELIHTFKKFKSMLGISLVHIESLNVILVIGGSNFCGIENRDINCQRFCLQSRKWKSIENIQFPYYGGQALLTKDEKYVILTTTKQYQYGRDSRHDDIYIIEIIDKDTYKLRKSKVTAPTIKHLNCASRWFVLSGVKGDKMNELLVNGFVRECKFNNRIPSVIISIICTYFNDQFLHCIRGGMYGFRDKEHFVISVSDILA